MKKQYNVTPRAQACAMAPATFTASVKVPPPQYDRMHCGLYVPEAGPVLRAGALDFKRVKTVGYPC